MNEFKDRLFLIQDSQNKLTKEVQALVREYESHDLMHENENLREKAK